MAGIFGCIRFDGEFDVQKACALLQKNALLGFDHPSETVQTENFGMGFAVPQFSENYPGILKSSNGRYTLVLFGQLFLATGDELSKENFEKEFLAGFISSGKEYFLQCDGAFVLALYDDLIKQLHLVTDPFGNFALQYTLTSKGFIFSTGQRAIVATIGEKEIKENALYEIFALGQCLNGKTLYKNVLRIPPASFMTVTSKREVELLHYYSPDYSHNLYTDVHEILRETEDALLRSVEKRSRFKNVLCSLSGGLDSRITLAALRHLGREHDVTLFTHGLPKSGDMLVAAKLAKKYNMRHVQIPFDDEMFSQLPDYWRETIAISEGAFSIEDAIVLSSWKRLQKNFRFSIDSEGGPLYRRQIFKAREHYLERSKDFTKDLFGLLTTPLMTSDILLPELKVYAASAALHSVEEYFAQIPEAITVGDKIDLYYSQQIWGNKYCLTGNAQMNYIGVSHPLHSLKAFASAAKLSARKRRTMIIYKYIFDHLAPELKRVRVDNSGYPVPYQGYAIMRYLPQLYERGLRRLPKYFHKFSVRKPIISSEILARKNFSHLRSLILDHDARSDQFFNMNNIEKAVKRFESGKTDNSALLIQVANLRLLLELFA